MAQKNKRGFFLTMMALAILSFMLLTTQVWVQAFEQSDVRASERFKGESMRTVLATISDKSFSDFANASAFFAMSKLVDYTSVSGQGLSQDCTGAYNDPYNFGTCGVNRTVYELLYHGESKIDDAGNVLEYSDEENATYTFASWQAKVRKAAEVMGFNATFSNLTAFNLTQPDPWHVNVYFEVQMSISDLDRTMKQSKTLRANSTFAINGFLDPMVTRMDMEQRGPPAPTRDAAEEKQIWKDPKYSKPADVAPKLLGNENGDGTPGIKVSQGFGWFSGYLTQVLPTDEFFLTHPEDTFNLSQYIYVGPYSDEIRDNAAAYGAIILTTAPVNVPTPSGNCIHIQQTDCIDCMEWDEPNPSVPGGVCDGTKSVPDPVLNPRTEAHEPIPIIVVNTDPTSVVPKIDRGSIPGPLLSPQWFVMFDNSAKEPKEMLDGYHSLWDTNSLRDMATCGFYVNDITAPAPSFFQRMVKDVESDTDLRSSKLGIESFVVGKWAGGADDALHDTRSRIDWEFYNGVDGVKIKSMPGCKDALMCKPAQQDQDDPVISQGVGRFKLSNNDGPFKNATIRYGLRVDTQPYRPYKNLYCGAQGTASCEG